MLLGSALVVFWHDKVDAKLLLANNLVRLQSPIDKLHQLLHIHLPHFSELFVVRVLKVLLFLLKVCILLQKASVVFAKVASFHARLLFLRLELRSQAVELILHLRQSPLLLTVRDRILIVSLLEHLEVVF